MFETAASGIGLSELGVSSGESHDERAADQAAYELTCRFLADGWTDPERHVLPDDLEEIPVGLFLAAIVASADRCRLNGHDAVRLMQSEARLTSHYEAAKLASMAEVVFSPAGGPDSPVHRSIGEMEYAAVEIAAALTLTRRDADNQLEQALSLHGRLRRVWDRFASGHIGWHKVREFVRTLGHLPPETIDTVLDRTLDAAPGLTTGQLRARISRQVMEADPDGAASSYHQGLADRKVVAYPNPDFTASLGVYSAEPSRVAAAMTHIDSIAKSLKTGDEERTLDQIRNDVALDLLTGRCHCGSAPRAGNVHLIGEAATLAGLAETPGELGGYGPVIAEITRKTALENINGDWTYTVTDNGAPIATGTLSRRPTAAQKRHVQATYQTCVMVGCRQPVYDCDLDHRRPVSQGGPTHHDNLGPLCRYHHMARHHTTWKLERLPNGDHVWTSPLGHTYTRKRDPPD